jgi:GTP-binding protein
MRNEKLRNVAIIAHVDHGKTTMVDEILKQTQILSTADAEQACILDSNDQERERGITILAKNISVNYNDIKINVIDTPGHSDFGGQVERVLNLADGVILLVDAAEGPMPQTRFVLDKALSLGLQPVVCINKIDKPDARPDYVLDKIIDLFIELDATEDQLEFPTIYSSSKNGWAAKTLEDPRENVLPLLDAIVEHCPAPKVLEGAVQMQVASIDYNEFVGRIGVGRVYRGDLKIGTPVDVIKRDGTKKQVKIKQLFTFEGLGRKEVQEVGCGDLCAVVGIDGIDISDTICDREFPESLPEIKLDEPTISMIFRVNDSPFYGKEGKFVSSRHIRERLFRETERDVALNVTEVDGDSFEVAGRGVLHISVLIESMRREGYELSVSKPHVIYHIDEETGQKLEPMEELTVDVPDESAGKVIELVGVRRGEMRTMEPYGNRQNISFVIPTRGLIGLRSKLMTATAGEGIVAHQFLEYGPIKGAVPHRSNGVLISMGTGNVEGYALDALQQRGIFFVDPGSQTYEGMILGEHCTDSDLTVNVQKGKQLTNVRSSGTDRALKIAPATKMSLEEALEYIDDDELLEVTPENIRLRKRGLTENERKKMKKRMNS